MTSEKIDTSKLEWDFSSFIGEDVDKQIEEERPMIKKRVETFVSSWKDRSDYLEDPAVLKKALDEYEKLHSDCGTYGGVGYYLQLMSEKKQDDEKIKAQLTLMEDFHNKLSNELTFFTLKISKIEESKWDKFLKTEGLKPYNHFLKHLFISGKYILSEKEERILNLKSGPARDRWVRMVEEFLSTQERNVFTGEKEEVKNFSEITGLLDDSKKEIRDSAAVAFNDVLKSNLDVATNEINAILQDKKINDELRGFVRPDQSRILGEDVDEEFVDSLLDSVSSKSSIPHRFYELKAKLLGLDKLAYHERNIIFGDINREFSYENSVRIVYDSLNGLDPDFGSIVKKLIEEGNVDVYPQKGKRGGAFCSIGLKFHPIYLILNHTNKLRDVETLAHEMGHALNHEMIKKQNSLNYGVPMVTAEVASNFSENIVFESLLEKASDDEERLALLMNKLNGDVSSVMRQVACYQFEQDLHNEFRARGFLSKKDIGELFQKHMVSYMGPSVEQSDGSENWWVYWSHIREFFYVYSYAASLLVANSLMVSLKEKSLSIDKIKDFYSAGMVESPRELFKKMGLEVNKEFWDKGLECMEKQLELAHSLAEKLGKL
jgi:oligoendopeptidase F